MYQTTGRLVFMNQPNAVNTVMPSLFFNYELLRYLFLVQQTYVGRRDICQHRRLSEIVKKDVDGRAYHRDGYVICTDGLFQLACCEFVFACVIDFDVKPLQGQVYAKADGVADQAAAYDVAREMYAKVYS